MPASKTIGLVAGFVDSLLWSIVRTKRWIKAWLS